MARTITSSYVNTYNYDQAVDGGATGTKALRGPRLSSGAIVTDALLIVDTALAGGTATDTLSLGTGETAADLQSALARNNALFTGTGAKRVTLTAAGAPIRPTADRAPSLTINNSALTAGKFRLLLTVVEVV